MMMLSYFILLFVAVMVPSDGRHGLFSIKSLSFLLCAACFTAHIFFLNSYSRLTQMLVAFTAAAFCFLFLWLAIGLPQAASALDQFKLFTITIFFTLTTVYLIEQKMMTFQKFIRVVIGLNFLYSSLKLLLVAGHLFHLFNVLDLMNKLGLRFMAMGVLGGLGRLQTSVDVLTPFILFFALQNEHYRLGLSKWFVRLYVPITWLSIALSFSRFFLMLGALAHLLSWITCNREKFIKKIMTGGAIVCLLVLAAGPSRVYKVIELRFFSEQSSKSDETRNSQVKSLIKEFEEVPFLGKGLGGHTEEGIRDNKLKHSYEVQWVAFLMQFGIIGISLIISALLLILWPMASPPFTVEKGSLLCMFLLWVLAGFTNPFLISLTSGLIYAIFLTAAHYNISLIKQYEQTRTHH